MNPENLPAHQRIREEWYPKGLQARREGRPRNDTEAHQADPKKRTVSQEIEMAAYELGWDTADRALAARGEAKP